MLRGSVAKYQPFSAPLGKSCKDCGCAFIISHTIKAFYLVVWPTLMIASSDVFFQAVNSDESSPLGSLMKYTCIVWLISHRARESFRVTHRRILKKPPPWLGSYPLLACARMSCTQTPIFLVKNTRIPLTLKTSPSATTVLLLPLYLKPHGEFDIRTFILDFHHAVCTSHQNPLSLVLMLSLAEKSKWVKPKT